MAATLQGSLISNFRAGITHAKYHAGASGMSSEIPARLPVLAFARFRNNDSTRIQRVKSYSSVSHWVKRTPAKGPRLPLGFKAENNADSLDEMIVSHLRSERNKPYAY